MPNDLDNDKDFPKLALDCGNWAVWREKAEDYIRGLRHYQADSSGSYQMEVVGGDLNLSGLNIF